MDRAPRAARRFAPFALAGALALSLGVALAQDGSRPKPVRGDGRGLASFGDRGLTTFGDRFTEGFSRRGLESFSDIPLTPMGGLEVPGPSERRSSGSTTGATPRRPANHHPPRSRRMQVSGDGSLPSSARTHSVASIRGVALQAPVTTPEIVVLPPVRLPAIVLDHRPALEQLAGALGQELDRARERGDVDAARTLAASLASH